MRITTTRPGAPGSGEAVVLHLSGRVDSQSGGELQAAALASLAGNSRLVLDFGGVDFVSSAGLRVVLMAAKQARAAGGGFAVFGLEETVRKVFDVSGFARVIPMVATEAEAVAAAGG